LKFASQQKLVRYLPVIFLASVLVTIASVAQAWMSCGRVEKYQPVSDPLIMERIEARLQALPAFKNRQIREINGNFAIAWQDEDECRRLFRCHYLLLDVRNNTVKDVLTFRGTGTFWVLGSPIAAWSASLDDDYSLRAFETEHFAFIVVRLPTWGGPVWVDLPDDTNALQRSCGTYTYN